MIRSYPFAMVFVFVRAIFAIPAIEATGELGLVSVVWTSIAAASSGARSSDLSFSEDKQD